MPNKTIYIRDEDLPVLEKALELGGGESLSAVIAEALKRYIAAIETGNYEEIAIKDGISGEARTVRFYGKEIAEQTIYNGRFSSGDDRGIDYTVYRTRKGKYLIHAHKWSRWQNEYSIYMYRIFDNLEKLKEAVKDRKIVFNNGNEDICLPFPLSLLDEIEENEGYEIGELLDI